MLIQLSKRNYEASVWTLQDEFITVLKWSGINNKGQIREPKMSISDDGTENLTFSIPMYIRVDGEKQVNPNWYNLKQGALMEGTRKIKIILNKGEGEEEAVYEFLITSVTEKHSGDTLTCEVTCEGACYHELGKIGYKVALSAEAFQNEDYERWKAGQEQPIANIDYWNQQAKLQPWLPGFDTGTLIPNPRIWYYEVNMDTSQYSGIRSSDKVYEDAYVSNWELQEVEGSDGEKQLVSTEIEQAKEKERMVDVKESNLYNITQTIAETFNVFCRYEYGHDEHYHIIYRKIIYYNNFIKEQERTISLTYPYTADEITRTKDSTDIITKLFVQNISNDSMGSGVVTIMDSDVNDMKEDYLFNFDYMSEVGSVTDAQYEVINKFKVQIREMNDKITLEQNALTALQAQMPAAEAEVTTLTNEIAQCDERITEQNNYILDLTSRKDNQYTKTNFKTVWLYKGDNDIKWKVDVSNIHGIRPDTIRLYTAYKQTEHEAYADASHPEFTGPFDYETDTYGNVTILKNLTLPEGAYNSSVTAPGAYLTCTFNVGDYHTNITKYWQNTRADREVKKAEKEKYYNNMVAIESLLMKKLDHKYTDAEPYYGLYQQKDQILDNFQLLMGPALREGMWNPEEYNDYGDRHLSTISMKTSATGFTDLETVSNNDHNGAQGILGPSAPIYYTQITDTPRDQAFMWDSDLFTNEDDVSYAGSLTTGTTKEYNYPCIDLRFGAGKHIIDLLSGTWVQDNIKEQDDQTVDWNNVAGFWTSNGGVVNVSNEDDGSGVKYMGNIEAARATVKDINGKSSNITIPVDGKFKLDEIGFLFYSGVGSYTTTDTNNNIVWHTDISVNSYNIGSQAQIIFLRDKNSPVKRVLPALMLTGAKTLSENVMGTIYNTNGKLYYPNVTTDAVIRGGQTPDDVSGYTMTSVPQVTIGKICTSITGSGSTTTIESVPIATYNGRLEFLTSSVPTAVTSGIQGVMEYKNSWVDGGSYEIVYPRIRIDSLNVKHSSTQLKVKLVREGDNGSTKCLTEYEDYSVLVKADSVATLEALSGISFSDLTQTQIENAVNNSTALQAAAEKIKSYTYITLKPEIFFKYGMINFTSSANADTAWNLDNIKLVIEYEISNAGTCIYIDAKDVLLENSQPKVTYTVNPSKIANNVIRNPNTWLDRIVSVNDSELHFQDVKGYISSMELDLDHPEQDSIEIKNYKSKFEDLFSSIVAQTESMKKREYTLDVISSVFTGAGNMTATALENSINGVDLDLAFSQGTLTISDKEGIWGTSSAGVVAFRGGGIFTANQKNDEGNWKWNSGILPSGINGSLITAGQIDTSKVVIMSGKYKYFQWNTDGLYAYKSPVVIGTNTPTQYVVYNGEGISLVAPEGMYYYPTGEANGVRIDSDVKRVEIGWEGLTLRNYSGDWTLKMDASTGNLSVKGAVTATAFTLADGVTIPQNKVTNLPATLSNQTKTTRKIYYLTTSSTAPALPGANDTIENTYQGTGKWCYSYPSLPATTNTTGSNTGSTEVNKNNNYKYYTTTEIITEGGSKTYAPNVPVQDLGVTSAMVSASIAAITSTAFTSNGLQAGYTWGGRTFSVALTSKASLLIGATEEIWVAKSASYSDGAAVIIDKSGIVMRGSTIDLKTSSGTTGVTIGKIGYDSNGNDIEGVSILSNSTMFVRTNNFIVDTNSFKVNPYATENEPYFKVGVSGQPQYFQLLPNGALSIKGHIEATSMTVGSGNNYMSFNGTTLTIKGNITATGGYIGPWVITNESLGTTSAYGGAFYCNVIDVHGPINATEDIYSDATIMGNKLSSEEKVEVGTHVEFAGSGISTGLLYKVPSTSGTTNCYLYVDDNGYLKFKRGSTIRFVTMSTSAPS